MTVIISIFIVFILLTLAIIWWHFIAEDKQEESIDLQARENTNVDLYHEHKTEIEKDYQQGAIDEENYQYLLAELDKGLLQDITEAENAQAKPTQQSRKLSVLWPVFLSLFILVFSLSFYQEYGALEQISKPRISANQHQDLSTEQQRFIEQVAQLEQEAKKQKDDGDLWYSLGQAYVSMGNFDGALNAFDEVIRIEGEKADLYGAKAQASYYQAGQEITEQVQTFINKAFELNVNDASTHILLGLHHFQLADYQTAVSHFQTAIEHNQETVDVEALQTAIDEAKQRLALNENTGDASQSGPQITLNVSLSDEIINQLNQGEDKTVFIYAVPQDGGRMPLAAVKVMASDLPTTILLTNAQAMAPQANLSSAEQVRVIAVVSQSGSPGQASGDFKGEIEQVNTQNTQPLALVIDTLIP